MRAVARRLAPLPEGFLYRPDFLSGDEERALVEAIRGVAFGEVRMHGVTARRRVAHFGWLYGYESWKVAPGPPPPEWLLETRARLAALAGVEAESLAEALITEYPPGAGIGWHRDAPVFGIVAAVSLAGAGRLRFQRGEAGERQTAEITLAPRSAYVLAGPARSEWRHGIPPGSELRYSVTFRTLRRRGG